MVHRLRKPDHSMSLQGIYYSPYERMYLIQESPWCQNRIPLRDKEKQAKENQHQRYGSAFYITSIAILFSFVAIIQFCCSGWFVRELYLVFVAGEFAILNDPLTANKTDHILQHFYSTFQVPLSIL